MKKLVVGVIAATLALAACGGSSKKSVNPVAGGTTAPTTKGSSSGGSSDDFSKLAGEYAKAKIKITYASTSSGSNETLTIAQDGTGKSAFTTGGSTIYNDGTKSIACEGTGPSAHCTDMSSLGGATANIGALFTGTFSGLAAALATLGGGDKSSDNIAGRDASCVKYKASDLIGKLATLPLFKDSKDKPSDYDPNDSATICVDKQTGYLLKLSSTKKGKAEEALVATAVGEPTDSDFTPPVTPATMPSLPGNITIPSIPSP